MITINSMSFSNVLSYGFEEQIVHFDSSRCVLVSGANGCGKSSIPTILEEALYNKNSRGIKKSDLFHRGTKAYDIKVNFKVNNVPYLLVKSVKSSTKVTLFCDGLDISGHTATQTYTTIESLLGIDFSTFSKLIYQSVNSSLDFLTATDANRKKFLIGLQGLEAYAEAEEKVKVVAKNIKSDLDRATGTISSIMDMVQRKSKPIEIQEPVAVPDEIDNSEQVVRLKVQVENIDKYNTEATKTARFKAAYENLVNNPRSPAEDVTKELNDAIRKHTEACQLQSQASSAVRKYQAQPRACPTCGHKLDIGDTDRLLQEARDELAKASNAVPPLSKEVENLQVQNRQFVEFTKYKSDLSVAESNYDSTKPTDILGKAQLTQEITDLQLQASAVRKQIDLANAINLASSKSRILEENRKQELLSLSQSLESEQAQLDSLELMNTDLQILVKALGTKGLISYKIESMVKVFEDLINEYLSELSDGRFALTFVVEGSKLALSLFDNSEEIDIKSLSSGELNRVNTATLLAVRKLMSGVSKTHINLLFLDEVVSVLDEAGKDCLIEVLLREKDLNSFVVSHGYSHPLADKMDITKVNGKSKIG